MYVFSTESWPCQKYLCSKVKLIPFYNVKYAKDVHYRDLGVILHIQKALV